MAKSPPKPKDPKVILAECMAACQRARAEGRHSSDCSDWCQACNRKVDAIYHVTLDRKRICLRCAARAGVRGARDHLQKFDAEGYAELLAYEKNLGVAAPA